MALSTLKTYKISKKNLVQFKRQGLSESALESLAHLEDQFFDSADRLVQQLEGLPHASEILEKKALILKKSQGYFRLDRWIHHKATREWVEALIFALVVATFVRTFLFAPFKIPSGSMIPTIEIGDHIFASRFSYGIPIPGTDLKLFPQPIHRGDIVIFPYPRDPSVDYIKRVIALGGETIEIRDDQVYINEQPLKEPYAYFDEQRREYMDQLRRLDPNVQFSMPLSDFGPVTVPPGKLFAMGDNRYNSADGREWGFVDMKTVKGKGQMIYWHHDPRQSMFTLSSYHWHRMFQFLK